MPREAKLLIYNIPMFLSEVKPETSLELLATGQFAGIKDSSGNWDAFLHFAALKQSTPFVLFAGSDRLYSKGRATGWSGVVSGIASCLPDLMVALGRAVDSHNQPKTHVLQRRLEEFVDWLAFFPIPVTMREAALFRKIKVGPHAVPIGGTTAVKLDEFRQWLRDWIPQMERDCKS
jgi:dihydrodipicolinate synthase/N-acetylneuraminate lyase